MAGPKGKERREPVFDLVPESGPAPEEAASRRTRATDDGERPASRTRSKSKKSKGKRSGGSGRSWRSVIGRTFYWSAVAGLWLLIAGIGGTIWVGAHLPPIQSLEIPKRPPTIKIVDPRRPHARDARQHGRLGGAAEGACRTTCRRPSSRSRTAASIRITASTRSASPARSPPTCCAAAWRRAARRSPSSSPRTCSSPRSARSPARCRRSALALWLEHKFSKAQILDMYLNRVYFGAGAYGIEAAAQPLLQQAGAEAHGRRGRDARGPCALAVAACAEPQPARRREARPARARRDGGHEVHHRRRGQARADRSPAHAEKQPGAGSIGYVADWIMDALDDLVGRVEHDIVVEASIDPALQAAAESALVEEILPSTARRPASARARWWRWRRTARCCALVGGQELRRKPVQPRGRGEAPARLGVQAVRLSHRARARAHARHGARGQADRDQRLAAGELHARVFRPGDAQQGAGDVAQHRVGAADDGVRADRGGAHRAPARHRLQARAQRLDRARHLRGLGAGAGRRLCAVRQRRHGGDAACGRARADRGRQAAVRAQARPARPHRRARASSR